MQRGGTVYILTNVHHKVLYTGVTADLLIRIREHKERKHINSFSSKYNVNKLVYYKSYSTIEEAITEEKRIKAGNRNQKIKLIQLMNAAWRDLWEEVSRW